MVQKIVYIIFFIKVSDSSKSKIYRYKTLISYKAEESNADVVCRGSSKNKKMYCIHQSKPKTFNKHLVYNKWLR